MLHDSSAGQNSSILRKERDSNIIRVDGSPVLVKQSDLEVLHHRMASTTGPVLFNSHINRTRTDQSYLEFI